MRNQRLVTRARRSDGGIMTVHLLARPGITPNRARPRLPGPGPQWFGAVMGTGILATLLQSTAASVPGAAWLAVGLLAVCWLALVGLCGGYAVRIAGRPSELSASIHDVTQAPAWGMVSMGVLSAGSATATVVPAHAARWTGVAWQVDAWCWAIGTLLGIVTALGFAVRLTGRHVGAPTFAWGLPIVPPMVSATTGAALVGRIDAAQGRFWLLAATVGCFFLALVLGVVVFAIAYRHHWRSAGPPVAASPSAWIPLGIVGQSTAAAQAIANQAARLLRPDAVPAAHTAANTYGFVMLALGVPPALWAVAVTVRGFRRRMPFGPGWWAMTFPIGTLSLGCHLLGASSGSEFFTAAGLVCLLVLVGTWTLAAGATLRAVAIRL